MRTMKTRALLLTMISLIAVASAIDAQNRRTNRSMSTNVAGRTVTSCGDIQVTYDRRPSITEETEMSLPASQVATLRTQLSNGGIYIIGWDRSEYSVKTCKAVPDDDPSPTSTLRNITTTHNGNGQLGITGPNDREWTASLIIQVPRLSRMEIETRNGPLQLRDLAGVIKLSATNGPISLQNVGGVVETSTTNGPVSLRGVSGDQRVTASNGPISIELSGSRWDGPGLEASSKNGPLSLSIPDSYSSGIVVQTSERSPVKCNAPACVGATRNAGSPSVIRFGSGDPVVRLTTSNGPLSIQASRN
jgi:hypothetical protein